MRGVYYAPGSLKARLCKESAAATYDFARQYGIPVERCGKLIVATNDLEVSRLADLKVRCEQNALNPASLNEQEQGVVFRLAACRA